MVKINVTLTIANVGRHECLLADVFELLYDRLNTIVVLLIEPMTFSYYSSGVIKDLSRTKEARLDYCI